MGYCRILQGYLKLLAISGVNTSSIKLSILSSMERNWGKAITVLHSPNGAIGIVIDNNDVIAPLYDAVKTRTGIIASTKNNL